MMTTNIHVLIQNDTNGKKRKNANSGQNIILNGSGLIVENDITAENLLKTKPYTLLPERKQCPPNLPNGRESRRSDRESLGYDSGSGSLASSDITDNDEKLSDISSNQNEVDDFDADSSDFYLGQGGPRMMENRSVSFAIESWEEVDNPTLRRISEHLMPDITTIYHSTPIRTGGNTVFDEISHDMKCEPLNLNEDSYQSEDSHQDSYASETNEQKTKYYTANSTLFDPLHMSTESNPEKDGSFKEKDMVGFPLRSNLKRMLQKNGRIPKHCEVHPNVKQILYCTECMEAMCYWCKVQKHENHKYTTIEGAVVQRKGLFMRQKKQLLNMQNDLEEKLRDLRDYEKSLTDKKRVVEQTLQEKQNYLHEMIDRWYKKVSLDMDSAWSQEFQKLSNKIRETEDLLKDITDSNDFLEEFTDKKLRVDLLNSSNHLVNNLKEITKSKIKPLKDKMCFVFTSGIELDYDMFGNFTTFQTDIRNKNVNLVSRGKELLCIDTREQKKAKYFATGLSITENDEIVVTDLGLDEVNTFTSEGIKTGSLNTLPADDPSKTVKFRDNCFAMVCKNSLKIYDNRGNFGHKLASCLQTPQGLAKNHNGDLVITDMDENGNGFIHIFAKADLRVLHSIVGGKHAPIFQKPWYCSVDHDNNIIVSDYDEHKIKVLDAVGKPICEFGQKGYHPGRFFHPAGTCVDKLGHILVADCYNSRVQMFNRKGEFLGIILSEEDDLYYPTDLDTNSQGHLVVLQGNGEVKVFQYIF